MKIASRAAAAALAALLATACSANTAGTASAPATAAGAPGKDSPAVGFIFVGPKDDFGYNQAAYQGSQAVAKALPDVRVLTAENVPEDDNAARVMNSMIAKGAKIIFATSYGHLDAALKVAAEHPDVAVVQQGNLITGAVPKNSGTYFGTVYEPVYLAGIAAGKATKSDKLGYVYAFPINQTITNIDAFQLGAASVNPDVKTYVVGTSSWCDPAKQAEAAANLLKQGVDVVTQHQDCTATIVKATEAAGMYTVGYHADASSLAPKGWLTGSQWDWDALFTDIVKTTRAGRFTAGKYNANFRIGFKTGTNPFVQAPFGPAVDETAKAEIGKAKEWLSSAAGSPFAGPVTDQDGIVRIPKGTVPDYAAIEKIDYFVEGVVGKLP
ncbi:BMP family ABC transporter substrate-binding protein [Nonomuraea insulae]|uniref:BMP family ABC transporter substrate-binding protein n=1 Tax=Nonomuraea insulae TaxID=1616787 RepID=A0ABW1CD68_9ACTN